MPARRIALIAVLLVSGLLQVVTGSAPASAAGPPISASGAGSLDGGAGDAFIDVRPFVIGPVVLDFGTVSAGIVRRTPQRTENRCLPFAWGIRLVAGPPRAVSFQCLTVSTGPNLPIPQLKVETFTAIEGVNASDPGRLRFVGDFVFETPANVTPVRILPAPPPLPLEGPDYTVTTVVDGLTIPWDLAFAPDGTMLFTERGGLIKARLPNGTLRTLATVTDLLAQVESGLLGLTLAPNFATTRRIYTCQSHVEPGVTDVRVVTWTIDAGFTVATREPTPVVTGLPAGIGRHNGCRVRFAPDGNLLVATGDAATGTNPQSLTSLGGKVLRINPVTRTAPADNPFVTSPNAATRLIYSYGHRNLQGLAIQPATGRIYTAEHGPTYDDEINLIRSGGNYGWDPVPGYNELVPMTDFVKFPAAIASVYSTGAPTLALSGATFITGSQWQGWNGALAVAALKASQLRVMALRADGSVLAQTVTLTTFGRLRTPVMGPDGSLYVTTSNGGGADKILRLTPS